MYSMCLSIEILYWGGCAHPLSYWFKTAGMEEAFRNFWPLLHTWASQWLIMSEWEEILLHLLCWLTATPCFIIAFRLFWWEGIGAKVRINSREKLTQIKCYENLFLLSGLRHVSCQHDASRNPEVTKILDFFELDGSLPSLYYQVIRERPPSGWVFVACACFPGEFYTFTFL